MKYKKPYLFNLSAVQITLCNVGSSANPSANGIFAV